MKKSILLSLLTVLILSSCVTKKEYTSLENKQRNTQDLLNTATVKLNACIEEKVSAVALSTAYKDQVDDLRRTTRDLMISTKDLTILTSKGADNLERSLESMKEKDLTINSMRDAVTRRDSVTLALVTSLKGTFIDINDKDIEVNVEKGVVFISISDKLLFNSGSYVVSERAKEVLGKVAKVVLDKPDIEFLVEGHTDNQSIQNEVLLDNWDLSVKRATSVVRVLQNDFGVQPERMTAAGRSYYVPVVDNDTAENRSKNRRTRIVVLPKLDQFYDLIEQGMKSVGN